MKKSIIFSLLLCFLLPSSAYAHVLLQDSKQKMGAILHVTPDDDPVASEPSNLVFDIQDLAVNNKTYSFTLKISDPSGASQIIPISIGSTVISANHTFPTQGLYHIELHGDPIDTAGQPLIFTHSQLVSRGPVATHSLLPKSMLAEIGLIASSCGLVIVGILSWNNRALIKKLVNKK